MRRDIIKNSEDKMNIVISWSGIPAYGARLIREGVKKLGQPVTVLGANPQMAVEDTEELLGQKVEWIDSDNIKSWNELALPVPDLFFQAGWFLPSFNNLGKEVRANGGKVICMIDNNWKNNLRQWLRGIKFRLSYRKCFDAVWVPGKSGTKLLRFLGMPYEKIYQGLYGVDHSCFTPGPPLSQRPKQFIFVGGLTRLKGVPDLVEAFKIFHNDFSDWKLLAYGAGDCQSLLENCPGIECRPFAAPPEIAAAMQQSRFFVMPTLTDHWPLVVAEASSVGCGLVVSDVVGNRPEFLTKKNGFEFPKGAVKDLVARLKEAASLPDWRLDEAYEESKRLGSFFGLEEWADKFCQIIFELGRLEIK